MGNVYVGPKFQSTRPTWGATTEYDFTVALSVFQSTRPTWGATLAVGSCICSTRFQSPRPTGGATTWTSAPHLALYVSIHAPHVGRDVQPAAPRHWSSVS